MNEAQAPLPTSPVRCPKCQRIYGEETETQLRCTRGQKIVIRKPIVSGAVVISCSRCGYPIYPL